MAMQARQGGGGRALRRALSASLAAVALTLLAGAETAFGHAVVRPGASRPAELQAYTLTVPNEKGAPTTSVSMQVPEGISFFLVRPVAGWQVKLERAGGRIAVVRWTGGRIPADAYEDFEFIARNPVQADKIAWKVVQRYSDGSAVRWVGPAESDTPAAETRLAEDVVPQDVVDVESGGAPSGAAAADDGSAESGSDGDDDGDGGDTAALAVAIVALVAALGALVIALRGRGRRETTP
jgi:uncharacterized protein YcnI